MEITKPDKAHSESSRKWNALVTILLFSDPFLSNALRKHDCVWFLLGLFSFFLLRVFSAMAGHQSDVGTVRGGKVSQWPKGVSFVCDAAASLRNGPGVTRCPNFNVAAASSHFLDATHEHIRAYARIYAYMRAFLTMMSGVQNHYCFKNNCFQRS